MTAGLSSTQVDDHSEDVWRVRCRPAWRGSGAHVPSTGPCSHRRESVLFFPFRIQPVGYLVCDVPCFGNDPVNVRTRRDEAAEV